MSAPKKNDAHTKLLEDLRAAHGNIAAITASGKLFAFRTPTLEEYEDAQVKIRLNQLGPAARELCMRTLVHGEVGDLEQVFEKAPAVPKMIGDELGDFARGGIEVVVKKG